ncbi:MAG: PHP domain-containing protein [Acidimicrobiales bacterium]
MIDLHTHSNFSDGSDSPGELARLAAGAGLRAIALTDHDTTESAPVMAAACAEVGVEHVVGVEVSLVDEAFPRRGRDGVEIPRSVHVLAYFCPLEPDSAFQALLGSLRADRVARNRRLLERLHGLGFTRLTYDDLIARAHHELSVGRPHFAQAMFDLHPEVVGESSPENWSRLFRDWLGDRGRAYLPKTELTIEDAVAAGGAATKFSIAHPHLNYLENASLDAVATTMPAVVSSLRDRGFVGVEARYGGTTPEVRALMVKIARDAGMVPTGGSDYHGLFKHNVQLGLGASGDLVVPDEVLDELRSAS